LVVAIGGAARRVTFSGARVAWEGGRSAADSESRHSRGHTVEDALQTIKWRVGSEAFVHVNGGMVRRYNHRGDLSGGVGDADS